MQNKNPCAYASKIMTTLQINTYAQIENELLAVRFGCEKFHKYLYGKKLTIETDHKPLISIFLKYT